MSSTHTLGSILAEQHPSQDVIAAIDRVSQGIGDREDVAIANDCLYVLEQLADLLEEDPDGMSVADARIEAITQEHHDRLLHGISEPKELSDATFEAPALSPGERERCTAIAQNGKIDPDNMRKFFDARGKKDHASLFAMTVALPSEVRKKVLTSLYQSTTHRTEEVVRREECCTTGKAFTDSILQAARARWSPDSSVRVLHTDEVHIHRHGGMELLVDIPKTQAAVLCDPSDGFLVHYKGPMADRIAAAEGGLCRVYVTVDPAFAESVPEHFFALCEALRTAGVRLRDGKALNPRMIASRFDNMVFFAPQSQLAETQAIIQEYMQHQNIGQGCHPAAVATNTPGVSVAREPNAEEQRYAAAVWQKSPGTAISYSQYLCARALSPALAKLADTPNLDDGYAAFLRCQSRQVERQG